MSAELYPTYAPLEGVLFNEEIGEWETWIDGEPVAWERDEAEAWRIYHDIVTEHVQPMRARVRGGGDSRQIKKGAPLLPLDQMD